MEASRLKTRFEIRKQKSVGTLALWDIDAATLATIIAKLEPR